MLYSILYIIVQYIKFIVHQDLSFYLDLTPASDPDFSKQHQNDSANKNAI